LTAISLAPAGANDRQGTLLDLNERLASHVTGRQAVAHNPYISIIVNADSIAGAFVPEFLPQKSIGSADRVSLTCLWGRTRRTGSKQ
jgi:hypothetical protein